MLQKLVELTNAGSAYAWGTWMLALLLGTGILLTIRTKLVQIKRFPLAFRLMLRGAMGKDRFEKETGDLSPFQALTTALAATVGNGNIAGVATAIYWGGPGAPFWMFLAAILGMATKYAEATLGVKFRRKAEDGTIASGPMYYIEQGIGGSFGKTLAITFAVAGAIASLFSTGNMMQSNSVALAFNTQFKIPFWLTGVVMTFLAGLVVIGGIKRIGTVAERLVPTMVLLYIGGGLFIILVHFTAIPQAIWLMIKSAFTAKAAMGGFIGATVRQAIRRGVSRGLLSNEAGLGSAPIAHGTAKTHDPARQGLIGIMEVFIDTIVVCMMTALVIILTGRWTSGLDSTALTISAFNSTIPFGGVIVALSSALFGFSTVIGWCYYGEQCLEYLFGLKITKPYRMVYLFLTFIGAILQKENLIIVWNVGDMANALMSVPNLIGLILLSGVVGKVTKDYFTKDRTFIQ